jgi:hypothetical protein
LSRTTFTYKAINAALAPTKLLRHPEKQWRNAVAGAEKDAGVAVGPAEATWVQEFGFLLEQLAAVPNLNPVGWTGSVMEARRRLANRLRIRHLHETRPAIADEPIASPVFVVGLPRTATTLAHRLLAASPEHRGPMLWEMFYTDLEQSPKVEQQRQRAIAKLYAPAKYAPDFDTVHPIDPGRPEESMFLLPHGEYRVLFHAMMPAYRAWLRDRDRTGDYEYLKAALQVLQHGRDRRRWVLKYPLDLACMDTIVKVFPDATFLWTHRDPTTVVGSLCSLMELSQSMYTDRPDRDAIGRLAVDAMAETIEAGRAFRTAHPGRVLDVPYHLLVSAPERYVPELYERLGARFTLVDSEHLAAVIARPVRDRAHEYSINTYGLDHDAVEARFGEYSRVVMRMS